MQDDSAFEKWMTGEVESTPEARTAFLAGWLSARHHNYQGNCPDAEYGASFDSRQFGCEVCERLIEFLKE